MELVTKKMRETIPPLNTFSINKIEVLRDLDPIVKAKFFIVDYEMTWYVLEFDGKDTFFGLVEGLKVELAYFSLSDLKSVKGGLGLPVERDVNFTPEPLSKIWKRIEDRRKSFQNIL
jgi:hypothetical protein